VTTTQPDDPARTVAAPTEAPPDRARWLGAAAAAVLVATVVAIVAWAVRSFGEWSYPLDDPYIHLRLAENLWGTGALGINPGEFASAASSMTWPGIMAPLTGLFDTAIGIPLVLATIASVVTLLLIDPWARHRGVRLSLRISLLVGMVVVVPLVLMSLTGMEHSLQIGLSILLVSLCVDTVGEDGERRGRPWAIAAVALVLAATRLEVVFVAAPLFVLLAMHRRWRSVVGLCVGAAIPLVALVWLDLAQGWPPLPASVSAKSLAARDGIARFLPNPEYIGFTVGRRPRLFAAVAILLILMWLGHRLGPLLDRRARRWAAMALSITVLHTLFSQTGWLYRYEAYMVALCLCASVLLAESILRHRDQLELSTGLRRVVAAGLVLFVGLGLFDGVRINLVGLTGIREIHQQQVQMARFAAANCAGCRVVLNDIGAVALYGDVTITDAVGLANKAVIESKLDGDYDAATIDRIARDEGATWAMIYPGWLDGVREVPDSWVEVGQWRWPTNEVVGGKDVAFYAIDPAFTDELRERFEAWPAPPGAEAVPTG
jgi:hypothetical protein